MKKEELPLKKETDAGGTDMPVRSCREASSAGVVSPSSFPEGPSLKERTVKGLLWGGFSNGIQQLLTLFFGIFLARLLTSADYGMVAMLSIFSLIAGSLQESGFTAALTNKKDISARDYNAVFWFNILLGTGLYALLFALAPLIARFYGIAELVPLSRYVFLGFLVSSFGIVPNAVLFRNLMVKQKTLCSTVALLLAGSAGVALACLGFAYWGIATQTLVYIGVQTAGYWYFSRWRPSFHIDFSPLRPLFGFSFKLLLTNVFNHINNNLLAMVLGRFYSASDTGFYNQACKWSGMGQQFILGMINGVAQPVLASVAAEEERCRRIFRKMLRFAAFVSFPALLGLALVAGELTEIAVGPKWLPSVPYLQWMCVSGAFVPLAGLYQQFIISQGKSDVFMWNIMASGVVLLAGVLCMRSFGIMAIVQTYVAVSVGWLPLWHFFAWRGRGLSLWSALADLLPYALAAAGVMVVTHWLTWPVENLYLRLLAKVCVAALLYVGMMWVARVSTLQEALQYLFKKKRT